MSQDASGAPLGRATAAVLLGLGLGLAGCADKDMQTLYGEPYTGDSIDADGDGWTVEDGDCDDENEEINPGATETTGDGIDSNCDGGDDT